MIRLLTRYTDISPQSWDMLVEQSPYATWFQTREAYLFYAEQSRTMHPFVFAVERDHALCGLVAGYITHSPNPVRQFFTRRAIIIGGALLGDSISTDALSLLLSATRDTLSKQAIYIEFRNLHDYSCYRDIFAAQGFAYMPHLNFQVDCTDRSAVISRIKSNRRRQIRKGLANGARIVEAQSDEDIAAWYRILHNLYINKVKTPLPDLSFFLSLYHTRHAVFLLVKHHDTVIGGIACPILDRRTLYEWYICGLDKEYRHLYPSVLATYAAIDYAATRSIACFDFMGAGTPDTPYGVRTFKSRFGGDEVSHGRFLHIARHTLYRLGHWIVTAHIRNFC